MSDLVGDGGGYWEVCVGEGGGAAEGEAWE